MTDQNDNLNTEDTQTPVADDAVQTPVDDTAAKVDDQTVVDDVQEAPITENVVAEEAEKAEPEEVEAPETVSTEPSEEAATDTEEPAPAEEVQDETPVVDQNPNARWYVIHTYSGHENKVMQNLKQKIATEHLENKIFEMLVPTQDKIEIRSGKKEQVKEKIFPGYLLVKMDLDDASWLAVRTTPGVTSFVGIGNKPTPISESEVKSIVQFMNQGAPATFKDVFLPDDTVKIIDGPFSEFIGKVDSVDKEKGKVRILVSIFGRETPVELDFLQVQKL
jgi:transcription termination/antitermination protein NusG